MEKPYSLEQSYELLDDISKVFLKFIIQLMDSLQVDQVCMMGIGNSISADWTATNNNVCPWFEKCKPFVDSNNHLGCEYRFQDIFCCGRKF